MEVFSSNIWANICSPGLKLVSVLFSVKKLLDWETKKKDAGSEINLTRLQSIELFYNNCTLCHVSCWSLFIVSWLSQHDPLCSVTGQRPLKQSSPLHSCMSLYQKEKEKSVDGDLQCEPSATDCQQWHVIYNITVCTLFNLLKWNSHQL